MLCSAKVVAKFFFKSSLKNTFVKKRKKTGVTYCSLKYQIKRNFIRDLSENYKFLNFSKNQVFSTNKVIEYGTEMKYSSFGETVRC